MITDDKKREIVNAINREKGLLGSMNNVAKKLEISPATISANLLREENWGKVAETMWTDVASALGVTLVNRTWNLAKTSNMKIMHSTLLDAQREALFIGVSEKAGSGKTASIAAFVSRDKDHAVYALQCKEWSRKGFLLAVCHELGITAGRYDSADVMLDSVVGFFKRRAKDVHPLLILDEADKLRPAAKRVIIPLYNELEGEIGLVCVGTENLEVEIKNGVRRHDKGYDEIDSRLGRSFVHLIGYSKADLTEICRENGVTDPDIITQIWTDCQPLQKRVMKAYNQEGFAHVVEDGRLIQRKITRAKLRLSKAA
jgi:hypothetical protein